MWINQQTYISKKLLLTVGILAFIAIVIAFLAAQNLTLVALSFPVALIAIILLAVCLTQPLLGYYLIILSSFFAFLPGRILGTPIPISTGIDILFLFVLIGTLQQTKNRTGGSLLKTPVTVLLIIYSLFFLVQAFNPSLLSITGWSLYARKFGTYVVSYVISYRLLDTKEKVKTYFKVWIFLSFITALYGCYQQWFGIPGFEMQRLMEDPHEYALLYQGGMLRKYSLMTDPVQFGVLAGSMAVFTLLLALAQKNKLKRNLLFFILPFLLLGMMYSGTRTAIITIPAGIALYALMTINHKRTIAVVIASAVIGFIILFAPVDNPVLNRVRTVLDTKEASLNIRDIHRKYIQPYIYSHPIGGGVGTSGFDGVRFNQGHPLAGFPPDSGLLKYAIETGWIGLFLIMLLYTVALCQGINYYYRAKDEDTRAYILATVVCVFSIIVTQYSQVSIGQLPYVIFFFAALSILKRLSEFDAVHTHS